MLPLTKKIWKDATQIVALSASLKETARKTAPSQAIKVIPNGVDSIFFRTAPSENNEKKGLKLISVARLIERKGIQNILYALAELRDPEISFLIVGTGNYEEELKKLCKELSLDNSVLFYGFCHPQKLHKLLVQNDVFILTSLAESFGMAFVEAMACGLPIIGADIGGIPDLIGKENGILVAPGDINQIKGAILKIKKSKQLRIQMSRANIEKMMEYYNWKSVTKQYIAIYQGEEDG